MYTRFYRWAMDRIGTDGVIAFVTNRSYIDGRAFDGFRKCIQDEFDFAYIIDTKSDVRTNPKIAGTTHNVFGIQTGVAILFLVRKKQEGKRKHQCRIQYFAMDDYWLKEKKLLWLASNPLQEIKFEQITPDKNNWINIADNDFDTLIPMIDKDVKSSGNNEAIFKLFSRGIETARDEWVYDLNETNLIEKMKYFTKVYNESISKGIKDMKIKWSSSLDSYFQNKLQVKFDKEKIIENTYRPFYKVFHYSEKLFNHRLTQNHFETSGVNLNKENKYIALLATGNSKPFHCLSSHYLPDLHLTGDSQYISLFTYDSEGNRHDNITDWGLEQFAAHYGKKSAGIGVGNGRDRSLRNIEKIDIFHYVYAVLHNPAYRKKYELNLKREFPRIPFYKDFTKWRDWGKELMEIHLEYETAKPYTLKVETAKGKEKKEEPNAKLKADREQGIIVVDENTTISGIPKEAWEYKLGNRSALEWILDQYKEKKPSDPTIAEKFNTYKFADYKEHVIDLLKRVCTVSVETVRIVREMEGEK
jgi:predicted helicase